MEIPQFNSLGEMSEWLSKKVKELENVGVEHDLSPKTYQRYLEDTNSCNRLPNSVFDEDDMAVYIFAELYYFWRKRREREHPLNDIL